MKYFVSIISILVSVTAISFAQWTSIGGPSGGGYINTLFVDKTTTPHTLYTSFFSDGVTNKGLQKSTDGGETWKKVPVDTTRIATITVMAIGPTGTLYAGGDNLYRSTDGGVKWTATKSSLYGFIRSIAVESASILYAGTDGGPYKSTDGGETWAAVGSGFQARTFVVSESAGIVYIGVNGKGVFKSTDGGTAWSPAKGGMTDSNIVALVLESPGVLYAATSDGGNTGTIMKTTNGGTQWTEMINGLPVHPSITAIALESPGVLYVAGMFINMYKTIDGGANWVKMNFSITAIVGLLVVDTPGIVYGGLLDYANGGLYKTTDGGTTWVHTSPNRYTVNNMAWNENTGTLYILSRDKGIFKTTNNGIEWIDIGKNLSNSSLTSIVVELPSTLYVTASSANVFKTTDDGSTWTDISIDTATGTVISLMIEKPGTLFAGVEYAGIFRSTDGGETWYKILPGINTAATEFQVEKPGVIYGRTPLGIVKTEDDGNNWVNRSYVTLGVEIGYPSHIALESPGVLYASMKTSNVKGIYKSTDSAHTWSAANSGLSDWDISSFAVSEPGLVYASSNVKGVFKTTDGGTNWEDISAGLTEKQVKVLTMSSNAIFAGTLSGVFKTTRPTAVKENKSHILPERYSLSQNYPNPFNPETNIEFHIPQNGFVSLKIYDALGREVAQLVNEVLNAGVYTAKFDGSSLSSGVYYCRMTAGNSSEMKKMLLLK
ncbi:MAG: YCF48-related protein [Bacteroidota bacterium]